MTDTAAPARILVLDGDQAAALAITRSLARRYHTVDLAGVPSTPLAARSNSICSYFTYPNPLRDELSFLAWLQEHLSTGHYDLVIPVTERTLVPIHRHRQGFASFPIAMAPPDSLDVALDKARTFELAAQLDIPIPGTWHIDAFEQLDAVIDELPYPIVIKPTRSVTGREGSYSKHSVSYAQDRQTLLQRLPGVLEKSPVMLQNYFQGQGVGIELIANQGEVLYAFQHLRLHEVPLTGGGSSLRASVEIEAPLLEASRRLMKHLNWTGVAMVEFKWNPDTRAYCLVEINGRFWGSLPLAVAAGADFPAMLVELLCYGRLGDTRQYRRGIICRNLGKDLGWLELALRSQPDGMTTLPTVRQIIGDTLKVFSPRHYFDYQALADPVPGLLDVRDLLQHYVGRLSEVVSAYLYFKRQQILWRNGSVRELFTRADQVLFVCYGNINRSAVAEQVLSDTLGEKDHRVLHSTGFHLAQDRPADQRMVDAASARGYDLSCHRSSSLNALQVENSDIIFVMEKSHRDTLLTQHPDIDKKVVLLGAATTLCRRHMGDILDPYNNKVQVYEHCLNQVIESITKLVSDETPPVSTLGNHAANCV